MMKFIASDLDAAKAKARRALGENVYVISSKDLPSGDIEIVASDKPAPSAPEPAPQSNFAANARDAVDEGPFKVNAGTRLKEKVEQSFSEDAFNRLTGVLSGGNTKPAVSAAELHADGLATLLMQHGVGDALTTALLEGAEKAKIDDDLHRLEVAFAEVFSFAPLQFSPATPILLVGPTGAGKTSCSAKLAAAAGENGTPAFMMTADVGRAGAIDQIRAYSDALGAAYYIIENPLDVQQAMKSHTSSSAIILDTPGVSPYDGGDVAALQSYRDVTDGEPVLVLPASGDAAEYIDWALAFKEIGVRRCIITKFDATKRVGAGLCAAHAAGLSLAHFSETPFISEGLLAASPEFLARRLIASTPGKIQTDI